MPPDDPTAPLYVGVEIGGTKLQLGLGSALGRLLVIERAPADASKGAGAIRERILELCERAFARARIDRSAVRACGIGFGGPLSSAAGVIIKSHQVAGWAGFPIAEWVRSELGFANVVIENDADAAGLAEARLGAGAGGGASPIVYVTIGSGIGGGLIIDGKIHRGFGLGALEIGHLRVRNPDDPHGATVELEQVASGWSIERRARDRLAREPLDRSGDLSREPPEAIRCPTIAAAALRGDQLALEVINSAASALAEALAHVVTLIAPRKIILGGGVAAMDPRIWIDPIREQTLAQAFPGFASGCEIVASELGEEVVVLGALFAAADAFVPSSGPIQYLK